MSEDLPTDARRYLACPVCASSELVADDAGLTCAACGSGFEIRDGIAILVRPDSPVLSDEKRRADFWNEGWRMRSSAWLELDREGLLRVRDEFIRDLEKEAYPSVTEIGPETMADKTFLNIGCGGGQEGLLFAGYGTRYVGVDISFNAAKSTTELVRRAGFQGYAYLAEAENLPLQSGTIEYVYSNGVLHHTPNTQDAMDEVFRVLEPGGGAMIGLYPTLSLHFFTYRVKALLAGNMTRAAYQKWLHANTELEWKTKGLENQWTRTFTRSEFRAMLGKAGFKDITIRQTYFQLKELPVAGKLIKRFLPEWIGEMRGGRFGGILMATCRKT